MAGPELRVNNISQINTSAFVEKETNTLQNGSIRLGKSIYNVKFVNGDIQVKFKNWFLNLFNRNRSNEIKSQLASKLTADKFVITESFNAAKKIGSKGGVKQVILYGMSEVREIGKGAINKANDELKSQGNGFKATTVDTYNASIGIDWISVQKDPVTMFSSIRNGTVDSKMTEDKINGFNDVLEPETRAEWKQFLQQNADKVDIFKKIADFVNEGSKPPANGAKTTGWADQVRKYGVDATLKGFILKQLSPNSRAEYLENGTIDKYVNVLKECVAKTNEGSLTKQEYESILNKYFPHHDEMISKHEQHDDFYARRDFCDVLTTAFFRQTSKLGLEFFQSKGIKIVFQWTNRRGQSMNTQKNKEDLHNKWWLDKNYLVAGNKNKYGSITYSEMRHIERLEQKLGEKNMTVDKLTGTVNSKIKSL